jgi:hypothetical protein
LLGGARIIPWRDRAVYGASPNEAPSLSEAVRPGSFTRVVCTYPATTAPERLVFRVLLV